jgi:NADH:ubiquinone oxidoreductase subunit F (NADH-binding)
LSGIFVCNAQESDPGAFTDRLIIESNPHQLLEGLPSEPMQQEPVKLLFISVPDYTLAVSRLQTALTRAREAGILGHNIFGSGSASILKSARDQEHLYAAKKPPCWPVWKGRGECPAKTAYTRPNQD